MKTPHSISPRSHLRAMLALGLAAAAVATWLPGTAAAYVSPGQAADAGMRGAAWFRANQEASGSLGSDWAMTALAAAGINAADVSTSLADPSAQDFYLGEWQAAGPGGAGTDAERGILSGVAGGIQPSRLSTSTDATRSNLVARLAELFDGTQIGEPGLLNDDIFGVLALHQAGAPQVLLRRLVDFLRAKQLPDGGWSWNSSPGAIADTDMTGSVIAAFCAAGVLPGDSDLDRALGLVHARQDTATGGFIAPPEAFGIGVNTDTTSWVVSGLAQCGIDPQGPEWTTDQGKTPFDYLVSMQRPDGHFDWTAEFAGGAFETYSAVRPLGGIGFSTAPPARLDGISPAVRPAAAVADGTAVPIALVIDHGPGAGDVRMCRVDVDSGSNLEQTLANAEAASVPGGCVGAFSADAGAGGIRVTSLNGVAETTDYEWRATVDGAPAEAESSEPIGFGDLVFLRFEAKQADGGAGDGQTTAPTVAVPPLRAAKRPPAARPRTAVRGRARWRRNRRIVVRLGCPRGNGPFGCRGVVTLRYRAAGQRRLRRGGSAAFAIRSGAGRRVAIRASRSLRRFAARRQRVKLRVVVATRAEDGAVRLTRARRFVSR